MILRFCPEEYKNKVFIIRIIKKKIIWSLQLLRLGSRHLKHHYLIKNKP